METSSTSSFIFDFSKVNTKLHRLIARADKKMVEKKDKQDFNLMSSLSLYVSAQLREARQAVFEDRQMKVKTQKMALISCISITFWVLEFTQIAVATKLTVPNQCNGNLLAVLYYAAPKYTPGALFCEGLYTICTMGLMYFIYDYYKLLVMIWNRRRSYGDTWLQMSANPLYYHEFRWKYIIECVICVLQPIPLLNVGTNYNPDMLVAVKTDFIFTLEGFALTQVSFGLLMFGRLYHILRLLRDETTVFKRRRDIEENRRTHCLRPIPIDWAYALRTIYHKQYPKFCIMFCIISIFFFAMAIYVTEWNNPLQIQCQYGTPQTFNFFSAAYMTIVTMASVGYGDVVAKSQYGRAIAASAAVMGVILGALITTTFMRWLELSRAEISVLHWVTRVKYYRKQREAAAVVLQAFWRAVKEYRSSRTSVTMTRLPPQPGASADVSSVKSGSLKNREISAMDRRIRNASSHLDTRKYIKFAAIDARFAILRKVQRKMHQKLARIDPASLDVPLMQKHVDEDEDDYDQDEEDHDNEHDDASSAGSSQIQTHSRRGSFSVSSFKPSHSSASLSLEHRPSMSRSASLAMMDPLMSMSHMSSESLRPRSPSPSVKGTLSPMMSSASLQIEPSHHRSRPHALLHQLERKVARGSEALMETSTGVLQLDEMAQNQLEACIRDNMTMATLLEEIMVILSPDKGTVTSPKIQVDLFDNKNKFPTAALSNSSSSSSDDEDGDDDEENDTSSESSCISSN